MGRLERRTGNSNVPYFEAVDNEEEYDDYDEDEYVEETQQLQRRPSPTPRQRSLLKKILPKIRRQPSEFGSSRNSYLLAKDIENNPTPEGKLRVSFSGRPLDLHALEDYLVWHTSPLTIKTILRYGHAKTMEDIRGYTNVLQRRGGDSKMLVMIVLAIILMVGGIMFLLYGPKLSTFFGM